MMDSLLQDEFLATLALVHTKGLGLKTAKNIAAHFSSLTQAVEKVDLWAELGLARPSQVKSFKNRSWQERAEKEFKVAGEKGYRVLLWSDSDYPDLVREVIDAPLYMYWAGNKELLRGPCLAMVGARKCSKYGLEMAGTLARDLSKSGVTIVSGFAWGIDRQSHMAAKDWPGSTIGILGTGLDLIYPSGNRELWEAMAEKGLLLTEFPPGTQPEPGNFPRRNRIISGLSRGVLVVEAEKKSGSLITAGLALEQNREVFAVPGPANLRSYAGCNQLIKDGAFLVTEAEDVLKELKGMLQNQGDKVLTVQASRHSTMMNREDLEEEERLLVDLLLREEKMHFEQLVQELEMDSAEVSHALLMLEVKDIVKQLPGMYYRLSMI